VRAVAVIAAACALLVLPAISGGSARAEPPALLPSGAVRATIPVTIESRDAVHRFQVEVARTHDEQERGLMFRRSLPEDGGMIFPVRPADDIQMWMKDTRLPLDILFIRTDGTISRIAGRARPYSLDVIDSGGPVAAVLEIVGGQAAALGIRAGDHVRWQDAGATR
jgi:uncharacterized membrane protein (UPF0127 family)